MKIQFGRKLAGSCDNGPCPAINEVTSQPGRVAVTGDRLGLVDRLRTRHARSWGETTTVIDVRFIEDAAEALGWRRP